jgi:hypothetical protein
MFYNNPAKFADILFLSPYISTTIAFTGYLQVITAGALISPSD